MRTLLICHEDAALDREGLARWLASFSTFVGTLVIREPGRRLRRRITRELKRVGPLRFLDVLAFRGYYRLALGRPDRLWEERELARLRQRFPQLPNVADVVLPSPNAPAAAWFIRECQPDLVLARCKTLLKEEIFTIAKLGTYVLHPGICPEYRNAHGCFWARARGDDGNVGATLLRIDRGVDTGPVYGYYRIAVRPGESHVVTEHRAVHEHLESIRDRLLEIAAGTARPIDTNGRTSRAWGQPWLTAHVKMRARESRRLRPQPIDAGVRLPPSPLDVGQPDQRRSV
jgi:hypothetical protein